jgi:hypothetical protein
VRFNKTAFGLLLMLLITGVALGQDKDKSLGSIKGKVRVETGTASGVTVVVRRGETEVTRVETQKGGDFTVSRLSPGIYGLTFRKPGLSIGTIEDVEVKAGKTRSLGDRLLLTIDEGSIAFLSGAVFNVDGRSVPGARVELARILEDGSTKRIDGRLTTETGSFKFRLSPDAAKYRVTVKTDGREPVIKDVDIDGAAVYRVALNLPPKP